MAVSAAVTATPRRIPSGSHLCALRRSAAVAAAGLAVWLAALGSSSVSVHVDPPLVEIKAPAWTYRGSAEGAERGLKDLSPASSCDID
jgi:hypothetical protein